MLEAHFELNPLQIITPAFRLKSNWNFTCWISTIACCAVNQKAHIWANSLPFALRKSWAHRYIIYPTRKPCFSEGTGFCISHELLLAIKLLLDVDFSFHILDDLEDVQLPNRTVASVWGSPAAAERAWLLASVEIHALGSSPAFW